MEAGRQRQFHIHHCLGRGGYGEVYRATMMAAGGIQNDVAVKLLRVDVDPGNEAVRRLRDEGRLLAVLRHPAILRVFDLALLEGRIGLVTEYVEGEDVAALIGVLSVRASVEVIAVVAEALDAAWNTPRPDGRPLRLIHRDIKPSNIRIGRHGEVKVLDFGIARSMDESPDREARTGTGSTVGSLAYMAPERFGRTAPGPEADVFGLGCTLYEALCGARLFEDAIPVEMFRLASDAGVYEAHVVAALDRLPVDLDPELRGLLARMLAYQPAARPTSAEVRAACESLAERLDGEPLRRWARERVWPNPSTVSGYLDGRVITEGTLSHGEFSGSQPSRDEDRSSETFRIDLHPIGAHGLDRPAPAAVRTVDPTPGWRRVAGGLGLLALVFGLGGCLVFVAGRWWPASPVVVPVPAPPPVRVEVPVPLPAPAVLDRELGPVPPVPTPGPTTPAPAPVVVAPVPHPPSPIHVPKVAPPQPAPVLAETLPEPEPPQPSAVGPTFGRVVVAPSSVKVELHGGGMVFHPGELPTGRYELFADFGYGLGTMGKTIDVVEGYETAIRCNLLLHVCDVAR
ncbi:MAG: serine/threonine-protein kinase [Myxococcota bacterium]